MKENTITLRLTTADTEALNKLVTEYQKRFPGMNINSSVIIRTAIHDMADRELKKESK
jgi:hypothetical protein